MFSPALKWWLLWQGDTALDLPLAWDGAVCHFPTSYSISVWSDIKRGSCGFPTFPSLWPTEAQQRGPAHGRGSLASYFNQLEAHPLIPLLFTASSWAWGSGFHELWGRRNGGSEGVCLPPAAAGRVITKVCPAQMGNRPLGNSYFTIETKSQTPLRREKNIINLP